jgi:glycosyltransferase involved in cell wall biosynthesis
MKLAFLGYPHAGGTYTLFRQLRQSLLPLAIDLQWLAGGEAAYRALSHPAGGRWVNERNFGYLVGGAPLKDRDLTAAFMDALRTEGFDGVLINVLTSVAEMNLARYMPPGMLRVMLVHNITPGTYAAARSIRDHVHATIAVNDRIRRDLVRRYGFNDAETVAIPNAVAPCNMPVSRERSIEPRLVFLGRIEDAAKGVFMLPRIMDGVDPRLTLTIAGDGPDLPALQKRCAHLGPRVSFLGEISQKAVSGLLSRHDILLMPSRYEGLPLTLLEAMAAGCVPVASRLAGVTDTIVTDGRDGCLVTPGSVRAARYAVDLLAQDPQALRRMSVAARETVRQRFSADQMAVRYAEVIKAARRNTLRKPPLDLANWTVPSGMQPGLRTMLPAPAKTFLRSLRERLAA